MRNPVQRGEFCSGRPGVPPGSLREPVCLPERALAAPLESEAWRSAAGVCAGRWVQSLCRPLGAAVWQAEMGAGPSERETWPAYVRATLPVASGRARENPVQRNSAAHLVLCGLWNSGPLCAPCRWRGRFAATPLLHFPHLNWAGVRRSANGLGAGPFAFGLEFPHCAGRHLALLKGRAPH